MTITYCNSPHVDGSDQCNVKRALCVAIQYQALAQTYPQYQLTKTHEDAEMIRELLIDLFGYKSEDIILLLDSDDNKYARPTCENIKTAMKQLVAGAKSGDRFVFHFSGHGSQITNKDKSEKDGLDEVIWPEDVDLGDPTDPDDISKHIIDDFIKETLVDSLPHGAHLTIIFDCCHSGTAADLPECHSDHYSRHRRNHFRVPGSTQHHAAGIDEFDGHDHDDTVVPKVSSTESLDEASTYATVVSWAACKDRQETYSCGRGGIFVHLLDRLLRKHHGIITHEKLLHELTLYLSKATQKKFEDSPPSSPGRCAQNTLDAPRPQVATLSHYDDIIKEVVKF